MEENGMRSMPHVKIELSNLKQSVLSAFIDKNEEIIEYSKECISAAFELIQSGELEEKIAQAVSQTINEILMRSLPEMVEEAVTSYFSETGKGIVLKIIKNNIKSTLENAFSDPDEDDEYED